MFQPLFRLICGLMVLLNCLVVVPSRAIAEPLDDLSQVSFSQLPAINGSGSLQVDGMERHWQAGQTPDQFLHLSDIESLQPQAMSIDAIAQVTHQPLSEVSIASFQPLAEQSVSSLLAAAPDLGQLQIKDLPALERLLGTQAVQVIDPAQWKSSALGQVVQQFPDLGELKLNAIDLTQFAINSLPGVSALPIGQLPNWQNAPINGVPGLNQVPLGSFPNPIGALGGSTLRIDFVHGPEEAKRLNTISGSDVEGFRVPCKIGRSDCAYIELDDPENRGDIAQSKVEGVQWISGKYQEVQGGHGLLKMVNGGKEPTGRLPYGDVFKVVIWEPDEKTDTVTTALYTRFCRDPGNCTPYFIGPIPHVTYKRDGMIFVGKLDLGSVPQRSSTPTGAKKGGPMPPMATFNVSDFGGQSQFCSLDLSKLDGVSKAALSGLPADEQKRAAKYMPYIMEACGKAGISDANQLAYVLATAQHESDHFRTTDEYSRTMYDRCGWGEGLIQVTWCGNKDKVLRAMGLSPHQRSTSDRRLHDPKIAAEALCRGMAEGWYTRTRLNQCISGSKQDLRCARSIVNGDYGKFGRVIDAKFVNFQRALQGAKGMSAQGTASTAMTCTTAGDTPLTPCPPGKPCPLLNPLPHMSPVGIYSRFRRCRPRHNGVDIQSKESPGNSNARIPSGGPVVAPDDGVVVYAGNDGSGYANIVKIYHPSRNISTFHAHLYRILVKVGQEVKRGQQIGVEGGNGVRGNLSYPVHLHFEIHQGQSQPGQAYGSRLDPENFEYEKPAIPKPGKDLFC